MNPVTRRQFLQLGLVAPAPLGLLPADDFKVYPNRWVYVATHLDSDGELERVENVVRTASQHGLNGMVIDGGFDAFDLKPRDYVRRLLHLKKVCDNESVELIPLGFNASRANGVLAHNKNLAAGLPVHDALYVAGDREAHFVSDSPARLLNGSFEDQMANLPANFSVHDGRVVLDTTVAHSGSASVRFDGASRSAFVSQEVRATPYRCYGLHCWIKTAEVSSGTDFHLSAIAPDGRDMAYLEYPLAGTSDWTRIDWAFNSWYADRVDFQVGFYGGSSGTIWVDDVRLGEIGLTNVLRRPGTPVLVRNEKTGQIYDENRDYAPITDPNLDFLWGHEGPPIYLLPGGRIRSGERLRVNYFHGVRIYQKQVVADMSEPEVYEIWRKQVQLIAKYLSPRKYFLSMDEIRVGGFCKACQDRHLPMAEILGDCVRRQAAMIHDVNPRAEILIWSDMFDPNHNAKKEYYLIDGSFDGTWKYLPKRLVIVCWYYDERSRSLPFFSKLGYQTLAGAYYDATNLQNTRGWLRSLAHTPGAVGIMYTTWQKKYRLLPAFGDLVSGNGKR